MRLLIKHNKKVALFLFLTMLMQFIAPNYTYALTSGPSQPEMKGFEPIGNSDMVDLFSGDFSYNIPLMDVGGYPVNLSYHSGASLDDESSWVGYGWSLNPGAVNRQLRGLPDDFNGSEKMTREFSMKEHQTWGAKVSATLDFLGFPKTKAKVKAKKKKFNFSLTLSAGVKSDNYTGIGVDIGVNAGLSLTDLVVTDKNSDCHIVKDTSIKQTQIASLGLDLSSTGGAGINGSFDMIKKNENTKEKEALGHPFGFGYNSRTGLQDMTLKIFKNPLHFESKALKSSFALSNIGEASTVSFAEETYTPTIDIPTRNTAFTLTLHLGPQILPAYLGLGVTGFFSGQTFPTKIRQLPAYGYLNEEKGKDQVNALLDFNREKDIPYSSQVNFLPVPVHTYDLFTASSQDVSGQFRAYRGSSSVLFDHQSESVNDAITVGIEAGTPIVDIGADLYYQNIESRTKKWTALNNFLGNGDFKPGSSTAPLYEPVYFKRVGEAVPVDKDYLSKYHDYGPIGIYVPPKLSNSLLGATAENKFTTKSNENGITINSVLTRNKREVRNTTFSYLTAQEANFHALDKNIKSYNPDSLVLSNCSSGGIKNTLSRTSEYRKKNHISEITITGDDGKRNIFGIPVYNTYQEEVSFSTDSKLSLRNKGLTSYVNGQDNSNENNKGRDHYYSKEITPAYATSYLLTGILSPDYVDVTGNGITDDDLGTAVKFNYTKLDSLYKWRTPYAYGPDTANYNEGFLSDEKDDKANYVYGKKEIWYLHSIESKTMVAQFVTEDRKDGLGVMDGAGAKNTNIKLRYLKEIRLYSKSDLRLNGNDPSKTTPIKVVHFVYNYSICRGLPNSLNDTVGKLTLDRVYFTFADNNKGILNPYKFSYDTSFYNRYDYRQYDRWGNFKQAIYNPGGLNNSEFPYTLQDSALAAKFAGAFQLNKITLPSGGVINVTYESDDYAYVQNKRASAMCLLNGVGSFGSSSGLVNSNKIYVDLPDTVTSDKDLKEKYFQNIDKLYFKFFMDLDNENGLHSEFVPGYAQVVNVKRYNDTTAEVTLKKVSGQNEIVNAGWQFLRLNLPKYAYPGSDNYDDPGSNLTKAIKALVVALGSIRELIGGFDKRAKDKKYCDKVNLQKSWVRLCSPGYKKYGGGSRVKKIEISDEWAPMSGATGAHTSVYTQVYDYTTKNNKGKIISSGVASYEPMLGNDENPFRQPLNYKQNQILALDNYYYIEYPMGESFFPAPDVGYSKVTVKSIGSGDAESVNRTGVTVSEFFTSKDYPTKVDWLTLVRRKPLSEKLFSLLGSKITDMVGLSQGFTIETNDMHGKPKSVNVFNKSGEKISSVDYYYKTVNELAESKELNNDVKIINADGTVADGTIGTDIEVFNDMRQFTTINWGISIKPSGGGALIWPLPPIPIPFLFGGFGGNYDKRSYRATSTVKLVQRFAIPYKTRKTENGSSITSENLLWDAETGNVLLTKTQNEFDDPVYSFAYPAHWRYDGMGQAYQNLGTVLSGFSTGTNGMISNSAYNSLLTPGDELIDINSQNKYWVIYSKAGSITGKRIIDQYGNIKSLTAITVKLLRSGRRNMANTAIATISSLNNPIVGNRLDISQLTKILDAKATVFNEEWSVPVPVNPNNSSSGSHCINPYYLATFLEAALCTEVPQQPRKNLFASSSDNQTAGSIMKSYLDHGGNLLYGNCYDNFWNGLPADSFKYYMHQQHTTTIGGCANINQIHSGDTATLGNCKLVFDYVDTSNQAITDYNNCMHLRPTDYVFPEGSCDDNGFRFTSDSCGITIQKVTSPEYLVFTVHTICSPVNINGCPSPIETVFNPYYKGLLGNWRPQSQYVYQVSRENLVTDASKFGSTDIRKSGAYSLFNPFWKYDYSATTPQWVQVNNKEYFNNTPYSDAKWIAANQVTYFNSKGLEIENKDALNRYSSALFGYLESMPVAVASNSRYREIAYDGFEDYGFILDCNTTDTCNNNGHFNFRKKLNGSTIDTTSLYAHTGKYSLKLNGNTTITKTVYLGNAPSLFMNDNVGQYVLLSNELSKGFSPIPGKKYVISFWINDGSPRDATSTVQASVNGVNILNSSLKWPVVEGWKRIEMPFVLSQSAASFSLKLQTSGTVYFDDIRIHPFDGQMKSFAYDPSSQRLMAEMDENNFATFYEYDDEGILIRVKKETERGIMTIKETRSSYRKQL